MPLCRKTRHLKQNIMKQINFIPIEEKTMNDKLVNLYGSHLVGLYTEIEKIYNNIKPAAPLLLELEQKDEDNSFPYEDADLRVMIFGRENNNWNDVDRRIAAKGYTNYTYNFNLQSNKDILGEIKGEHTDEQGVELPPNEHIYGLTDIYHDYCYEKTNVTKRQFTRRMYQFIDALQKRMGAKRVGFVWNNLFKIGRGGAIFGKCCGQSPADIKKIEKEYFDVIRKEVEILAPHVIIFMTGTAVDNAIMEKFNLPHKEFPCINDNLPHLRRVEIPGIKYAARTIHPAYKSNDILNEYNNALIEDILKHI